MFVVLKLKYIIKGKANAALTLASDTILNNDIIIMNTPSVPSPTCHESPRNTPSPVATALPPFQLSARQARCVQLKLIGRQLLAKNHLIENTLRVK